MSPKAARFIGASRTPNKTTRSTQVKKPHLEKEQKIKVVNLWAHCDPCICATCKQSTHKIDKDSPAGRRCYTKWTKSRHVKNKAGKKVLVCTGTECYICYDVRRKWIRLGKKKKRPVAVLPSDESKDDIDDHDEEKMPSAQEVSDEIKANPDFAEKIVHLRRVRCSEDKTQYAECGQLTIQFKTEETRANHKKECIEGTFIDLWAFNDTRRLGFQEPQDEEALMSFILEKYPSYRIEVDDAGQWQVAIDDLPAHSKRYRIEIDKCVKSSNSELHGSKDDMKARLQALQDKLSASQDLHRPGVADSDSDDDGVSSYGAPTTLGYVPTDSLGSGIRVNYGTVHKPACSAGGQTNSDNELPQKRPARKAASVATSSTVFDDSDSDVEDQEQKTEKRSAAETSILKARAKQALILRQWSWSQHFKKPKSPKEFAKVTGTGNSLARKISKIKDNDEAVRVAESLFKVTETLDQRQNVFLRVHEDFVSVAQRYLEPDEMSVLLDTDDATIIVKHIEKETEKVLMSGFTRDVNVQFFLDMVHIREEHKEKLSLSFCQLSFTSVQRQIHTTQKDLVLNFSEKLWKTSDVDTIVKVGKHLVEHCKGVPCDIEKIDPKEHVFVNGWSAQPLIDISTCAILAQVLESERGLVSSTTRKFKKQCVLIVQNKEKISSRLRSFFKHVQGARSNHCEVAWKYMQQLADKAETFTGFAEDSAIVSGLEALVSLLNHAVRNGAWEEVYDAAVDVVEHDHALQLAENYSTEWEDSQTEHDRRCFALATSMTTGLLSAVDIVLQGNDDLAEFWKIVQDGKPKVNQVLLEEGVVDDAGSAQDESANEIAELGRWFVSVLHLLSVCHTGAADCLAEAKARVQQQLDMYELAKKLDTQDSGSTPISVAEAAKSWADMWLRSQVIAVAKHGFVEGAAGSGILKLTKSLGAKKNWKRTSSPLSRHGSAMRVLLLQRCKRTRSTRQKSQKVLASV